MKPETSNYLQPIIDAAKLLKLDVYPSSLAELAGVLDKVSRGFPRDVMPPVEALKVITGTSPGTVEELALLEKVWPDGGTVRYKLTATDLTWTWSGKHTSRYATIRVPFPTILPMQVEVTRHCDMDEETSHSDVCPIYHSEVYGETEAGDDCDCEGWVEQQVSATVTEWDKTVMEQLGDWLARAIEEHVEPAMFPAAAEKKAKRAKRGGRS